MQSLRLGRTTEGTDKTKPAVRQKFSPPPFESRGRVVDSSAGEGRFAISRNAKAHDLRANLIASLLGAPGSSRQDGSWLAEEAPVLYEV